MFRMLCGATVLAASLVLAGDPPKKDGKDDHHGHAHDSHSHGPAIKSVYECTMKDIDGKDVSLAKYKGEVLMIVNVASKCGYTESGYTGLEALNKKYKDKGLRIIGVPANNFGGQEPGSESEIKTFCSGKGVTFDMLSKVSVKGADQCPLYKYLTTHPNKEIAGDVPWNFTKYLVGRDGTVLAKWGPKTAPEDKTVVEVIEKALAAETPKNG